VLFRYRGREGQKGSARGERREWQGARKGGVWNEKGGKVDGWKKSATASLTGIIDAVDNGRIYLHEQHCRILECDLQGLDEGVDDHGGDLHVALINFGLRQEPRVACELAQTLRAPEQDVRRACLGQEAEHEQSDGGRRPDGLEERPPPGLGRDGKAAKKRTEGGCV
jgi:hypothetical protein